MNSVRAADAVVVGGGTIGAWTAWFLKRSGLQRVVLVEAGTLGQGASSRAAGMVRAQGGTATAVRLGLFSRDFYLGQAAELGIDSGFVAQGYYMPCFTPDEVAQAHRRIAMQQGCGLDVSWVDPEGFDAGNANVAPGRTLGASYAAGDGYIDPPRNVLAYTAALFAAGVEVQERTAMTGLVVAGGRVTGVRTSAGEIATERVVITGGPQLRAIGESLGARIPSAGVRHQVVVTEPHPDVAPERLPMVFDVVAGIYWRPCEDGVMWGMSNPDEPPGVALEFDWGYYEKLRERVVDLMPVIGRLGLRRAWAATIDYTPDHLPILGPLLVGDGAPETLDRVDGTTVAAAGGHGMMWGPGVARAAADLALTGTTDLVDATELGLDRFDETGHSRLEPDPIALPFPERIGVMTATPTTPGLHALPTPAVADALGFDALEDWGPLAEATGEPMATRGLTLWEDGPRSAGIWECTAGPSYWVQDENEVIQVLAGRMTVTVDGGEPVDLGAGDLAVFPKGWSGTWDIHETIRKVYAIF